LVRMAPHLVRPARFLIPFRQGDRRPPWMMRLGLTLYDALAGAANLERHQVLGPREARTVLPRLASYHVRGGALYSDAVMDDARLTLAVAIDAIEHGAEVATHTEVTAAHPNGEGVAVQGRDLLTGDARSWDARVVVNATGAWSDGVREHLVAGDGGGAPML